MRESTPWSKSIEDLPLGVISGIPYTRTAIELEPNDLLLLYTDGILGSVNEAGEQLGLERVLNLARKLPAVSAARARRALLAAVADYRGVALAPDDETVIALQRASILSPSGLPLSRPLSS